MAFTLLMFVVLVVSFALMFMLVKFTENVIATNDPTSQLSGEVGKGSVGRETMTTPRQVGAS